MLISALSVVRRDGGDWGVLPGEMQVWAAVGATDVDSARDMDGSLKGERKGLGD